MPNYLLPTSDNINASAGLISLLIYINNATYHWLARLLLVGIYIVVVMAYYKAKGDFIGGIAISGFATFVIGFLLFISGFVTGMDLAFFFGAMILGVAWILIDHKGTA